MDEEAMGEKKTAERGGIRAGFPITTLVAGVYLPLVLEKTFRKQTDVKGVLKCTIKRRYKKTELLSCRHCQKFICLIRCLSYVQQLGHLRF